jgi:hypothetical protein
MRILLTKISDQRHVLEVVRGDGSCERVELVSREFLFHDLLHYAVECAMVTEGGFWGALASGKTLAELDDRTGASMGQGLGVLAVVEQAVGMMTGALKSEASLEEVVARLHGYHRSLGQETPAWCRTELVAEVRERMRRIRGRWKAVPYRGTMELGWPGEPISPRGPVENEVKG